MDILICFHFLALVNSSAANIRIQVFVWVCGFCTCSSEWSRSVDHVVTLCLKRQFWVILLAEKLHEKVRSSKKWILGREVYRGLNLRTPAPWQAGIPTEPVSTFSSTVVFPAVTLLVHMWCDNQKLDCYLSMGKGNWTKLKWSTSNLLGAGASNSNFTLSLNPHVYTHTHTKWLKI